MISLEISAGSHGLRLQETLESDYSASSTEYKPLCRLLCVRDFRRRKNKAGQEYGWGIAVYCLPEHIWGYAYLTSQYRKKPKDSALEIIGRVKERYPDADERALAKVLGRGLKRSFWY